MPVVTYKSQMYGYNAGQAVSSLYGHNAGQAVSSLPYLVIMVHVNPLQAYATC